MVQDAVYSNAIFRLTVDDLLQHNRYQNKALFKGKSGFQADQIEDFAYNGTI